MCKSLITIQNCRIENNRAVLVPEFTWKMNEGEVWLVIGPNGGGKADFLNALDGSLNIVPNTDGLFSDIFSDLFGGSGFDFGFGNRGVSSRSSKGKDKLVRVDLSFEEAVFGCKKTVNLDVNESCSSCDGKGGHGESSCSRCGGSGVVTTEQHTMFGTFMSRTTCPECNGKGKSYKEKCSKCHGTGKVKINKNLEVTIPAGVDTGNQLRLSGKGESGSNGGPNGDVYLEFNVSPHEIFERNGNDIYLELPITVADAVLGCKRDVPTIHGSVRLTIKDGATTGDKYRLKGKGIEDVHSYRKGDMYVIINVTTPKKLTRDQRKLFESLAKTDLEDDSKYSKIKKYL